MSKLIPGARPRPSGPLAFVAAARALEAQGRRVVRLDIGEPHVPTPPHIVEAAHAAMRDGRTRYVAPQGLLELREAIATSAAARGIDAAADRVVVTSGVKPMLLYALLAVVRPGDQVLIPDPGYTGYAAAAQLAGATACGYPLRTTGGRTEIDLDELRAAITPATRVLVLNSPHNPTGMVIDDAALQAIAELAGEHDLWILSDEIYHTLTYDGACARGIAAVPGLSSRTIVVDGFSKAYAMTGWRLGYAILPAALVATVTAIVGDAATCTPPFVQHAGIAALTGPQDCVAELRRTYGLQRETLVRWLRGIPGVEVAQPRGALYAFADMTPVLERAGLGSSAELAMRLLHEHGVASVAGSAFGAAGERHLRLSFGVAREQLDDALIRMADFFGA